MNSVDLQITGMLRVAGLLALGLLGCGQGSPQATSANDSAEKKILGQLRVILSSDFEEKPGGVWTFGGFEIGNEKDDDATIKLLSQSCSCVKIIDLPQRIDGHGKSVISMSVGLGRDSPRQSIGAVLQLDWPNHFRRVTVRQDIEIRSELKHEPVALTFRFDPAVKDRQEQGEIAKDVVVRFHYRSPTRCDIASPFFVKLPSCVTVAKIGEAVQRQLPDDVWEVTWHARLRIENAAIIDNADIGTTFWTRCCVPRRTGGVAFVQVPMAIAARGVGVTVHPESVVLDSHNTKRVVLKSEDGKPFLVWSQRSSLEAVSIPVT